MKTIRLKDILSISGKGGLFKFVAEARNGIVVESIENQKRHVAPSTARVSSLEDIAIFTEDEEVPLSDIFYQIHERNNGEEAISHKSAPDELKAHFRELVPEYDEERVYVSDIRKVFQWYNQLQAHSLLEVIEKEEEKEGEEAAAGQGEEEKAKADEKSGENKEQKST
jgi:hypothetical protein